MVKNLGMETIKKREKANHKRVADEFGKLIDNFEHDAAVALLLELSAKTGGKLQ